MGSGDDHFPFLLTSIMSGIMSGRSVTRFLLRWIPLLAWMAFISFASSDNFSATNTSRIIGPLVLWLFPRTSVETLEVIHLVIRKIAHFSEYGVLALLAARASLGSPHSFLRQGWFLVSLILVASYALIDEYHQSFVPSRTPSIYDSLIDVIGGSAVLLFLWARARRKHSSN